MAYCCTNFVYRGIIQIAQMQTGYCNSNTLTRIYIFYGQSVLKLYMTDSYNVTFIVSFIGKCRLFFIMKTLTRDSAHLMADNQ